jgi:hypothetical protein
MKTDLIEQITKLVKYTHNEQDIKDLESFSIEELKEILKDILDSIK